MAPGKPRTIARGVIGGVAEARVVDRPGGEAGGDHRRQGENRQADDRPEVPPDDAADGAAAGEGQGGRSGKAHGAGSWTRTEP